MENFSKGYTQVPHKIGNILPLIDLTARQKRVVDLVIRLTYGCQKRYAKLRFSDLKVVNIAPSHAGNIMFSLLKQKIIIQNGTTKEYRLNEEYLSSEVTKNVSSQLEELRTLIGKQLDKRGYQIGKQKVTREATDILPEEKDLTYQNSNDKGLPKREDSDLKQPDFTTPKDILNKELKKEIDSSNIADNSFKGRPMTNKNADPEFFVPTNDLEYAAKVAWEQIEPENPDSFGFYLWAMKQGLPADKFFEFSSEIKDDPKIKNKGAVFNKKVQDYLEYSNQA